MRFQRTPVTTSLLGPNIYEGLLHSKFMRKFLMRAESCQTKGRVV
jgi:hypothetical protein